MPLSEYQQSSLRAAIRLYMEDSAARRQAKSTLERRGYDLEVFRNFSEAQGVIDIKNVDKQHLESFRRFLNRHRKPNGDELGVGTIRNRLTAVKTMLTRLHYLEVIPVNPAYGFELPRLPKSLPMGFFTEEEVQKLLNVTRAYGVKGLKDRCIMEVMYATGIRRTELANLNLDDIDFENSLLTVRKGKGNKDRRVPIAPLACINLQRYIKAIRPMFANTFSGQSIFLTHEGKRYLGKQLSYMVKRTMKKAGINRRGACNLFRHTTATLMSENGADIPFIQKILGHASISTTEIYTHVTIKKLREVYANTHPMALTTFNTE